VISPLIISTSPSTATSSSTTSTPAAPADARATRTASIATPARARAPSGTPSSPVTGPSAPSATPNSPPCPPSPPPTRSNPSAIRPPIGPPGAAPGSSPTPTSTSNSPLYAPGNARNSPPDRLQPSKEQTLPTAKHKGRRKEQRKATGRQTQLSLPSLLGWRKGVKVLAAPPRAWVRGLPPHGYPSAPAKPACAGWAYPPRRSVTRRAPLPDWERGGARMRDGVRAVPLRGIAVGHGMAVGLKSRLNGLRPQSPPPQTGPSQPHLLPSPLCLCASLFRPLVPLIPSVLCVSASLRPTSPVPYTPFCYT